MSLLMDALRKAERDKKKAADSTHQDAPPADSEDTAELAEPGALPPDEESTEPLPRVHGGVPPDEESTEPLPRVHGGVPPEEESTEPLPRVHGGALPDEESTTPIKGPAGDVSLELEPLSGTTESLYGEAASGESGEFDWSDIEDETAQRLRATEKTRDTHGASSVPGAGRPAEPYDQESTLPSERTIKSSLKDYFEASRSMERPAMRLVSNEPETEIETGVRETTHVDAQTVFAAGESASPSRYLRWTLAAVLVLAVTLGAVGFWYYYLTPTPRMAPSPRVVQGLPNPAPEAPAVAPAPPPAPATGMQVPSVAGPATPAAGEATPPPTGPAAPEPGAREASGITAPGTSTAQATAPAAGAAPKPPQAAAIAMKAPAAQPSAAAPAAAGTAKTKAPVPTQHAKAPPAPPHQAVAAAKPLPAPPASGVRSTLPANIEVPPSAIQITRSRPAAQLSRTLTDAYDSFRSGNLDGAQDLYQSVLARHDDQRDALLGLAAVAVQRGHRAQAYALYQRILRLNPQDPVANAAVASLTGGSSPGNTEARLKMLLEQDPSAAYLHFALGNLYARQGQWPAAQQEYFDAYRGDDGNADYAYNLAVSLDRLGSGGAALTYYRKALELAKRRVSRFSTTEVMSRIKALSAVAAAK